MALRVQVSWRCFKLVVFFLVSVWIVPSSQKKRQYYRISGVFLVVDYFHCSGMFESGVKLDAWFKLCLLSNPQARDENASRTTRLPGGKSFFQKPDAKPRAALGSIANTLVERNAAGKVSSVSPLFSPFHHYHTHTIPQVSLPYSSASFSAEWYYILLSP